MKTPCSIRVEPLEARIAPAFAAVINLGSLDGLMGFKLSGIADSDFSGIASAAGDVNGDGFGDVIIGGSGADEGGTDRGAGYVVFGKGGGFTAGMALSSLNGSNGFKLSGAANSDRVGVSVSAAGDVNGDGFDDLLIGANRADEGGYDRGACYVVFGKTGGFAASVLLGSLNGSDGFKLSGAADSDLFGASVSAAGDVNGDGFADLLIGAYRADEGGTNRGAGYVVFGKAGGFAASVAVSSLSGSNGFKLVGLADTDYLGGSVSTAGDVNGDGFADLIIGARYADEGGANRGASYVVFGKASGFGATVALGSLNGSNGFKLSGVADFDYAGKSVSAAGDVNGDGFADLLVGAPDADEGGNRRGASYVIFGKAAGFGASVALGSLNGSNGFKLSGVGSNDLSGRVVSATGDLNGDGFGDLLIGAYRADEGGYDRGASYVVFGKAGGFAASVALGSLDGSNGFKLSGVADVDQAGSFVSAAGDVNGDGFADLIIGSTTADETGTNRGATYVVFGQPDMKVELASGVLTLSEVGAPSNADLTLSLNGANIRITDPTHTFSALGGVVLIDPHTVEVPLSSVTSGFVFDTAAGDDSLVVDFSGGNPFNVPFNFIGGRDTDVLTVTGGSAGAVSHILGINGKGVFIDSTALTYSGIESFTETVDAATRFFGFDTPNDIITVASSAGSLTALSTSAGDIIQFASPTSSLLIRGGGGNDSVTLTSLNPSFTGTLEVDGEGGTDRLTIGSAFSASGITSNMETVTPLPLFEVGPANAAFTTGIISFQSGGGLSFKLSAATGALTVNGALDLNGAALVLTSTLTSLPAAPITIIDLAGTVAALGTFSGLPENATVNVSGANFRITYTGGTGNDVQLIPVPPVPPGVIKLGELDGTKGFIIHGQSSGDQTGGSVSSAGDINGDGLDDFIVGANGASNGIGAAYVVFGKTTGFPSPLRLSGLNGTDGFRIEGIDSTSRLALSVSKAGDVNGDGKDDILASASNENEGGTYVIFGTTSPFAPILSVSDLNGTNGFTLQGAASADRAEHTSVSAGDINGDGVNDIIIGMPSAKRADGTQTGAAYVVFGHTSSAPFSSLVNLSALTGANGFKIHGETANDEFGTSVSSGDINGDGFDDLFIGAPSATQANETLDGAAYVLFGKSTIFSTTLDTSAFNGKTGFKLFGGNAVGYLGSSIGASDINGDGLSDILIGASNDDGSNPAPAYVVFGKRSGYTASFDLAKLNGTTGFALSGEDRSSLTVGNVGDFNGDGFDDLLIGARRANTNGTYSGTSYLVFGRPSGFPPTLPLSTLNGTTGFKFLGNPGDSSGSSVNGAGDINGDGKPDLIIGASLANVTEDGNEGKAYVVFGSGTSHAIPISQAKGKTLTYTDTDGDLVSVTVSKGKITADMLIFGPDGGLFLVDLTAGGTFKDGANLTFSIKKTVANGIIHVGAISAPGITLGNVKITGDLGQIDVGGDPLKSAIKSLTVGSLGVLGADMQLPGTVNPRTSDITGGLPKFIVKSDINLATINVTGKLGKLTVGGDFLGTGALSLSQLEGLAALGRPVIAQVGGGITLASSGLNADNIGSLNVAGNISNAAVNSNGSIGSVSVTGNVNNGAIVAASALRVVKVFGSITSDAAAAPSVIAALATVPNAKPKSAIAINSFLVKGNVTNAEILIGYNKEFLPINSDASVGSFTVKGVWTASSLTVGIADITTDGLGQNDRPIFAGADGTGLDLTPKIISRIAKLTIGTLRTDPAEGSVTADDHFGITAQRIDKAKINGIAVILTKLSDTALGIDNIPLGTNDDFRLVDFM